MNFGELLRSEKKNCFYLMHLSYGGDKKDQQRLWNYALENNLIGLDSPKLIKANWTTLSEEEKSVVSSTWKRQFNIFCFDMKSGDYVVVLNGVSHLLGIGKVSAPHKFNYSLSHNFFNHTRKVGWKLKYDYEKRLLLPQPLKGFNNTLSKVTKDSSRWSLLEKVEL
jgi:predicted Mrr-cat superfamily restriction endonuclease